MIINVFVLLYILSENSKIITAINNAMIINKKVSKIYKLFVPSSYDLASAFASIIYTNIHLRKLVDNICYFHEKQL